ncbi:MAG: MltA domain-containing protein [Steroidobacteraceae bacterium]
MRVCGRGRAGSLLLFGMLFIAACTPTRVVQRPESSPQQPEPPPEPPQLRLEAADWSQLPGWAADSLPQAWPALLASCAAPRLDTAFAGTCGRARTVPGDAAALRAFIERELRPWQLVFTENGQTGREGLITGYYEPVLRGARQRGGAYQTPLYGVPPDLVTVDLGALYPALQGERVRGRLEGRRVVPYPDRAQLADGRALAGRELLWVDDPVDAFFLQIQGSGRVRLTDGKTVRLAFADVNGHPYKAIGRYLVERGELTVEQATAPGLREWLRLNPQRRDEVLASNPSVVFFREEPLADPALGPRGALGAPLTAGRSVAVDPRWLPLGAPLFLSTTHPVTGAALQRLVLAQDTGGAIRGALRADLFFGLGPEAGDVAGRMRQPGRMWLLWPAGAVPALPRPAGIAPPR